MIGLGIFLIILATVGVVCAVFNIAYNPEEYEYEDMRPGLDTISHEESRQRIRKGEQHGETR